MNYNKTTIGGNLTRDPDLRYTPNNTAVCKFGIAVNRKWKDKGTGKTSEETTFIDCEAWGRTAETINEYFQKGRPIFIEGRLKLDQWEDKQSGQNRSKLFVVVESFQFCGGDKPQGSAQGSEDRQPIAVQAVRKNFPDAKPLTDEQIPF